ncbi:ROK family protein (plasmid) [Deinococcus radiomollis]|uniref:ROK family protein n=1 Tax=Deinococcus radiomollis TaxID=468916 RepID=UPI0038925D71
MTTYPEFSGALRSEGGETGLHFGVDLGGTKLAIGTLAGELYTTPTPDTAEGVVASILAGTRGAGAIGICAAGRVDPDGGTLAVNLPQLGGFPLVPRLRQQGCRVLLINDADAAALAEHHLGAAQGADSSLYVTVSTGIGAGLVAGGLVAGGRLFRGTHGQALELGHVRYRPGTGTPAWAALRHLTCPCGRKGCMELLCSGTAIVREGRRATQLPDASAETLAALAQAGDARMLDVVSAAASVLGEVLADACVLLDPEVVVLGGGVTVGYGELFLAPLRSALAASLGDWSVPKVRPAGLGASAGVLGALMALQETA